MIKCSKIHSVKYDFICSGALCILTRTAVRKVNDVILTKLNKLKHSFVSMNRMPHP